MSLIDNLRNLQQVEAQLRGLRSRLDSAQRYLNVQNRELGELTQRDEELQQRHRQKQAEISNLEGEIQDIDTRLEKLRTELNSSVNNKQYTAVLNEMQGVKEQRGQAEDQILQHMEELEGVNQERETLGEQIQERARVRDHASAQLQERQAEVGDRVGELEQERDIAASNVPEDALAVFEELADTYEGEAMAPVEEVSRRHREYACGACHMQIPFDQVAALTGQVDKLIQCGSCQRILYMAEEMRGSLAKK